MSQGAAPVTTPPPPMNYSPASAATPQSGGIVGSGAAPPAQGPSPEPPGMWDMIKSYVGKTAGDFLQSLGDTPEERQQNLATFTKTIAGLNSMGKDLQGSTLMQRLGAKHGAEMVAGAQQAANTPRDLNPTSVLTPEMAQQLMDSVGLGVQGIRQATGAGLGGVMRGAIR